MKTYLVFNSKATADTVAREIAATPFGAIWLFFDPDGATNIISYLAGSDGRQAIIHDFDEWDRDWLEAYLAGWTGVQVLDSLPADWKYPTILP